TVIRWPAGTELESAHVAEGALVDATGVRVERPAEGHAVDLADRGSAGLLAIFHPHSEQNRTCVLFCQPARDTESGADQDGRLRRERADSAARRRNGAEQALSLVLRTGREIERGEGTRIASVAEADAPQPIDE